MTKLEEYIQRAIEDRRQRAHNGGGRYLPEDDTLLQQALAELRQLNVYALNYYEARLKSEPESTEEPVKAEQTGESYGPGWAFVKLMVHEDGTIHVVGGDRQGDPDADGKYIGAERIMSQIRRRCVVNQWSSVVCQFGTKGCEVQHARNLCDAQIDEEVRKCFGEEALAEHGNFNRYRFRTLLREGFGL